MKIKLKGVQGTIDSNENLLKDIEEKQEDNQENENQIKLKQSERK